jgi:ubiquinone biosynthesis protein COQ9
MEPQTFDAALVRAAFEIAGLRGWRSVSVASAARLAGIEPARARLRFPVRAGILIAFGRMADQAALTGVSLSDTPRDRLFDMLMRRIDVHQAHRAGVIALLDHARSNPPLAMFLALSAENSMAWMLEGAAIEATGLRGIIRVQGLVAVWLATLRAWIRDTSDDLPKTMAALDKALQRAERAAAWLDGGRDTRTPSSEPDPLSPEPDETEPTGYDGDVFDDGGSPEPSPPF